MGVTLYYHPLSQPCRAVFVFLKCADVKFDTKVIDVFAGEHKTPGYVKICPLKQIPAIDFGSFKGAESAAIMKYVAAKNPSKVGKHWFGRDKPETEALVEEFVGWQQSGLRKHCINVFIPTMRNVMDLGPYKKEAMDIEAVNQAKEAVKDAVKLIADHFLQGKKFIGGTDISIADLIGYCELQQLNACGEENLYQSNPKVKDWMKRVEDRIKKPIDEVSAGIKDLGKAFLAAKKSQQTSTNDVTLYYHPLSQPSRAVFVFLKCAGVPFNTKVIDVFAGEHKTPDYVKICSLMQIPAIVYDGFKVAESAAIMKYIATMNPSKVGKHWFGKDKPETEARVDEFVGWQQSGLRKHCLGVFIPTMRNKMDLGPYKKEAMDVKAVNEVKVKVKEAVELIADRYLQDKFIGGADISIADLLGYCELQQLNACGEENLYQSNPKVKDWMKRVEDRIKKPIDEASAGIKDLGKAFSGVKK